MDPLSNGDYPPVMKQIVGARLPEFTDEQSKMLKGSFDFIGANYYTGRYVLNVPMVPSQNSLTYNHDYHAKLLVEKDGVLIGPKASLPWLHVYPEGIKEFLVYIKKRYNNPVIYVTENGIDDVKNEHLGREEALQDTMRVEYFYNHLYHVREAMRDGVDVRGYFAWSLMDNFEWQYGYTTRFGLYYVDYKDGLKRYPKASAKWFKKFLTDMDATMQMPQK